MVTRELTQFAKVACLSAGVTLFVVNDLASIAKVEGNSMQPTFNPTCGQKNEELRLLGDRGFTREMLTRELKTRLRQDRVLLNKWVARDRRKLRIGDVVIFKSPRNPSKTLIKRITAMPGDTIHINETGEIKIIEEGHCWVEGDNQHSSYDSNNFGQVPLGLIEGQVCFIIWPMDRIRRIRCDPNTSFNSKKTVLISQQQQVT